MIITTIGITVIAAASGRLATKLLQTTLPMNCFVTHVGRGDVVPEREREGEDRAGDDRRKVSGMITCAEGPAWFGPEVLGGAEQGVRDPLEAGVDRDDHVRQPDVAHYQPDGDRAVAGAIARTVQAPS